MKKIGIVGLGIMGKGMAINFLKNNYEVCVYNRTKSVCESLEGSNLHICDSPKEVAENADVIFEVTANHESSEAVWYGDKGILAGADSSKILIVSSTLSIDYTDKLINDCKKDNLQILDIPLTGGRIGAETGNLTLLCGGEEELLDRLKPIFEAIAGNVFYFGPSGHGMRYKLLLNFVQASHILAFGEAMQTAKKQGMDLKKVGDALAFRPGGVITEIANKSYFNEPDPITFSIEWITKDLRYAKELEGSVDDSVLEVVLGKYKKFEALGNKNKDWMSINNYVAEEIEIIKLDKSYVDKILTLEADSAPEQPFYFKYDKESLEDLFEARDKASVFGAFIKNALVGWASYRSGFGLEKSEPGEYAMSSMVVSKNFRKLGIGTMLFEARINEILKKKDLKVIIATAYPKNTAIISLFLKNGFYVSDFKKNLYGEGADRVYLRRETF